MNVHLVRLNPYDEHLGVLVPLVATRIRAYAAEHTQELDPTVVMKSVMVPLWQQDPFMCVLALVNEHGVVVGHAAAAINTDGFSHWLSIIQTKADGAVGDAIQRCIEYARNWVDTEVNPILLRSGKLPVTRAVMASGRNEKAWERAYGFRVERRVLSCPISNLGREESETISA